MFHERFVPPRRGLRAFERILARLYFVVVFVMARSG
jgi:hypothetical protein